MFDIAALFPANSLELLEVMTPGPELAAALDGLDRESLSGDELVSVMIAHQRLASHYAGEMYCDMAAVQAHVRDEGHEIGEAEEFAAAEIGAALRLTKAWSRERDQAGA